MPMRADEIQEWVRDNLFDEVPIAISVISPDFQIVEANRGLSIGFTPDAGTSGDGLLPGRPREDPRQGYRGGIPAMRRPFDLPLRFCVLANSQPQHRPLT